MNPLTLLLHCRCSNHVLCFGICDTSMSLCSVSADRVTWTTGLGPSLPEDLWYLIKKAVAVPKQLERNRRDHNAKFQLMWVSSGCLESGGGC
jgi:ribosomal protein S15P/S13E